MTHIRDDLFIGGAQLSPQEDGDFPSGFGVGPLGRVYLWDVVPLTKQVDNLALAQELAGAGAFLLTAGTGVTLGVNSRGETVLILDTPRAVSVTGSAGSGAITVTVTGYDYAGQPLSEAITHGGGASTVDGKKAFKQILSATSSAATADVVSLGTTDVLGAPVRFTNKAYLCSAKWDNTFTQDTGTPVVADTTDPATTTTGDVRGTYTPSSAADGSKRLVVLIGLPGVASGPNATRVGAYGANQNLYGT